MKLFLALLLVASCQAIELFDTTSYEVMKEVELKNLVKVAEEEMFKQLVKEYPNEDPKLLQQLAHQIALLVKHEVDAVMALIDQGSKMAQKMTRNMWENLKKAAEDIVSGLDSVPESMKKFTRDLINDVEEMEKQGVHDIYLDDLFDHITERVASKIQYGDLQKRGIGSKIKDTINRIVNHLTGKYKALKEFFKKTIKKGLDKMNPHIQNVKQLAKEVLHHVHKISKTVAKEAVKFFRTHRSELGEIWFELVKAIDREFNLNIIPIY